MNNSNDYSANQAASLDELDENYHRDLFENMLTGIVVLEVIYDESGKPVDHRLLRANAQFDIQTGLKREEEVGKSSEQLSFKWPDDVRQKYYSIAEHGGSLNWERYNETLKAYYDIRVFSPKKGQFAVMFYDITERKKTENKLAESENRLRAIINSEPECIKILDDQGRLLEMNPAGLSMIEADSFEQVAGNSVLNIIVPKHRIAFTKMLKRVIAGETMQLEFEIQGLKGGQRWLESHAVPMHNAGKTVLLAITRDITERKEHERQLEHIAHYDALTGIPNRTMLADRMNQAIAQTSREQHMLAVCYLDLDSFKPINDAMGHAVGDQVLIEVANRLGKTIRGGDTVARLGGDEFVLLISGLENGNECVSTLQRLLEVLSQLIIVEDKPIYLSASIGVSIYPLDDEDPDTLLRHADQAMYVAKQSGKNRFHIYDAELDRLARSQTEFLKSIQYGLEHDQFELYYQPKINLRTNKLVGAEALIRWHHPEQGLLTPALFLRLIENTDLDIKIGEWVTATALAQINQWQSIGLDIEVSINISGYHLESPLFVERLKQQISQYPDIPFGKLQIEMLETVALNDIAIVREIIESCHELGVGFALDDFGTGYSSLTYLNGLPVDVLKIDQSFVRDMLQDKGDMAIVQGIIALARAFDRHTVAEGIETDDHLRVLRDMGCEFGQGYGIARPMPASALVNWRMGNKSDR
jgi:diguanylate cyclase (GGDEF)-like protein/PAS domain S-box-containing protein